jgi:Mg2+-importing ATPase
VVSGTATAVAFATGRKTAFGEIAVRLATRPPQTEFERGVRQFGFLIMKTAVFLVLFVFLVTALAHHAPLESLLFAVALAVGLTPEFLPMITSVTLAHGAVRMARKKVIVKHLASMQNFGSIDLLCSDKTGTLTTGEMELERHVDPLGGGAEKVFLFAYVNSFFETGVANPVDTAIRQTVHTNPLDAAILRHAGPDLSAYRKLDENPFDFERRRASVVVQRDSERFLIVKGAPETVLAACTD